MYLNFANIFKIKPSIYSYNQLDICLRVKTVKARRKTSTYGSDFSLQVNSFTALGAWNWTMWDVAGRQAGMRVYFFALVTAIFLFSLFTWYGQVADSNLHITKQSSSSSNPENWNTAKMSLNIAYIVDNNSSQMLFVAFEILHVLWICQFSGSYSTLNLQPSSVSRTLTPSFLNVFLYFSFFFPPLLTYLNHLKPLVVYWASSTQKRYND